MTNNNLEPNRTVYSLGAKDGLWTGLTMGACILCMVLSSNYPLLSLVGLALFIYTPFMVWRFLRRGWVCHLVPTSFSAVWLHGICIFLFGGIIMALMMYVSLRFVVPGWIESQTLLAVRQLEADPTTADQAHLLSRIVETGQLPSAIYTSVSSIWLVAFTGSLWSMLFALILTQTSHFKKLRNRNSFNQ